MFTENLASESVQNERGVDEERNGDEDEKRNDGGVGVRASAGKRSKLDLRDVDERKHEEGAAEDGSHSGDEHSDAEGAAVDVRDEVFDGGGVVERGGAGEANGLLERKCDKAGEEKGAEGVDVEGDEVLGDGGGGSARRIGVEIVLRIVRVPS